MNKKHKEIYDKVDPYNFERLSAADFERHQAHFCKLLECLVLNGNSDLACSFAYNEAQHYRHLAQIDDGIREEAKKYAELLLEKAREYDEKTKNNNQSSTNSTKTNP